MIVRRCSHAVLLILCGLVVWGAGCAMVGLAAATQPGASIGPTDTAPAPAGSPPDLFAPVPAVHGYDPERAEAALAQIADNPPAPGPGETPTPELPRQALRHLAEARRLFGEQRYSETVIEAGKTLRYHQDVVEAHRLAALASLLLGKTAQARQHADSALELQPDDLACRYVRGRLAEKADDPEAALFEYRTALKCPVPPGGDVYMTLTHHQLGLVLHELGYYRAAVDQLNAFESAAARAGDQPADPELASILRNKRSGTLIALAEAQEALGRFGPAADSLAAALRHAGDHKPARVRHIKNLVRAGRFDAAQAEAVRCAEADKDRASAELLLAVHQAAGRPEQGLAALEQLVAQTPDNADLQLFYADALIGAKSFEQAVKVLNELAQGHPKSAAARWKLVSIHRARGHRQEWLRAVGAQLAAEPTESAQALAELGRLAPDQAGEAIDEALGRKPAPESQPAEPPSAINLSGYYYCLGWLADHLNRIEDAQALYAKSLEAKPELILATIGMAELWVDRCQWNKALDALKDARPDAPVWEAAVGRLRGRCYDGLDNLLEATRHYRDAIEKNRTPETMLLLGRLLDRFHQAKDAADVYEQILRTHPGEVAARELLVMNLLNRWSEGENLKTVLAQIKEMQDKWAEDPATTRTTAMLRLLMRQPPDFDAYVRVLTSLVEARPADHQSRRALAVGLIRQGKYDEAIVEVQKILGHLPRDSEANELLSVALMRQLSIDEAADQLARNLEWYPNREALLRNLAEIRLVQQDYPAAMTCWQKLLSLEATQDRHALYRNRIIDTCLQAGWFDRVREFAEGWLADAEKKEVAAVRSYLLAADAAQGKHEPYLERCRQWLAEDPRDEQAKHWLLGIGDLPGQAKGGLIGAGRADEAIAQATAWAAKSASDPVAQYTLLQTLRAAHRPADIIEICRANLALVEKPQQKLSPLQMLADACLLAERYDEAVAAVREMASQAAQITEADLSFQLDELLVSFLAQAKRYGDAVAQANRILSALDDKDAQLAGLAQDESADVGRRVQVLQAQELIRQRRSQVLRSLSFIYTKQDRRDQAIECLRQALELAPDEAGINNDLGYTLADAGMDLDEAERMLKAAVGEVLWNGVGDDEHQAAFLDSLGWLYYKRGQFEQARRWLSLGAKMPDGDDPVINDHLGDVEWRLGHADEAVRSWERALALHDRKVAEENGEPDEKFVATVNAKLAAADARGRPAVATAASD